MKSLTLIAAVVLALLGVQSAFAQATPRSSLINGAQIVLNAESLRDTGCVHPLNKAPSERCRNDYDKYIDVQIEFTARHVLYLRAATANSLDNKTKAEYEAIRQKRNRLALYLDCNYNQDVKEDERVTLCKRLQQASTTGMKN